MISSTLASHSSSSARPPLKTERPNATRKDATKLMKRPGGILRIHGHPWYVPKAKANRRVIQFLKQLPKKELRSAVSPTWIRSWRNGSRRRLKMNGCRESPKQLWEHRNMLTTFQVWVIYRLATGPLRLHYSGAEWGSSCPQDSRCDSSSLSNAHIAWSCYRAQTFWKRCLEHWTGLEVDGSQLEEHRDYFFLLQRGTDSDKASMIDTVNSIQEFKIH
ncbi:hypothetical protein GQ600_13965 [Phytophthora cactorum]|nr:hypothetical protein GQ600_13965 [Phytophthora cactorum]